MLPLTALTAALALGVSCNKNDSTVDPERGSNLVAVPADVGDDGLDLGDDDDFGGGEFDSAEDEEDVDVEAWPKIGKPGKAVKKCKGKGKKKECKMVDSKPKISAAIGTRTLLADFRFGMTPMHVFKLLTKEIDVEYDKKQAAAKDPTQQDRNRAWRQDSVNLLKANHVKFTVSSKHRWGVSLIQYEYEDDSNEEMLWIKANPSLRKFYFFKDDELWKVLYAYSTDTWPGKTYDDVVEEKFKKWFGPSPAEKVKTDPESGAPVLSYNEWESADNMFVRSFDMTAVNGVIVLAVVDKDAESRIGERLPNLGRDDKFSDDVTDILGDSDVCYDKDGNIQECSDGGNPPI